LKSSLPYCDERGLFDDGPTDRSDFPQDLTVRMVGAAKRASGIDEMKLAVGLRSDTTD
jgi:hypothetical protein